MENTFSVFLPAARGKGVDFNFTVADNVPEISVGDQTRINQFLTNLAGNAVKFTKKGKWRYTSQRATADLAASWN
jgi:signal transduction histidine kinase